MSIVNTTCLWVSCCATNSTSNNLFTYLVTHSLTYLLTHDVICDVHCWLVEFEVQASQLGDELNEFHSVNWRYILLCLVLNFLIYINIGNRCKHCFQCSFSVFSLFLFFYLIVNNFLSIMLFLILKFSLIYFWVNNSLWSYTYVPWHSYVDNFFLLNPTITSNNVLNHLHED